MTVGSPFRFSLFFADELFPPCWRNKIRRRFYSPYNKLAHRGRYFICRYFGAEFLVRSANVGGLEISAKIAGYPELKNFMSGAAAIKPDIFIDVGANLGLYTCILLKNRRCRAPSCSSPIGAIAFILAPIS